MLSKEKLTLNIAGTAKACADLHVLENALRAAGGKAPRTASCISLGRLFHAREFMVVDSEEGTMSGVGDAEPWLSIYTGCESSEDSVECSKPTKTAPFRSADLRSTYPRRTRNQILRPPCSRSSATSPFGMLASSSCSDTRRAYLHALPSVPVRTRHATPLVSSPTLTPLLIVVVVLVYHRHPSHKHCDVDSWLTRFSSGYLEHFLRQKLLLISD